MIHTKKIFWILIFCFLLVGILLIFQSQSSSRERTYLLSERKEMCAAIQNDDSLTKHILQDSNERILTVYTQRVEDYGTSGCETWVLLETEDEEIVLQDGGCSIPVDFFVEGNTLYVFGCSTAFSTVSGINITKYTIEEQVLKIDDAIDSKSVSNEFFLYQDELNPDLFSILPSTGSGMGHIYFNKIEDASTIPVTVTDGEKESTYEFTRDQFGRYSLSR